MRRCKFKMLWGKLIGWEESLWWSPTLAGNRPARQKIWRRKHFCFLSHVHNVNWPSEDAKKESKQVWDVCIRLLCIQIERENPKNSMVLENKSYEVCILDLWAFNLTWSGFTGPKYCTFSLLFMTAQPWKAAGPCWSMLKSFNLSLIHAVRMCPDQSESFEAKEAATAREKKKKWRQQPQFYQKWTTFSH